MRKSIITFSILLYAIVVPFLEINETHVFNPNWTPHSGIGLLCLWLVWVKNETRLSSILSLLVTGGFLLAYGLKNAYGGSMKYLDGSEKTLLGINIGVLGFGMAFILVLYLLMVEKFKGTVNRNKNEI